VLFALSGSAEADSSRAVRITTLSTDATMVTGSDVLLRIDGPAAPSGHLRVSLNGEDVTNRFISSRHDRARRDPRWPGKGNTLVGLVDGLRLGANTIAVRGPGRVRAELEVVNHPITGPVFSGPHQTPFVCTTALNGLGDPLDDDCSASTRVDYFYRSTSTGNFVPLTDPSARPGDLAQTTTLDGTTVDYIVRVESGTINRHIYHIAILEDPGTPVSEPWAHDGVRPGPGWNGKLAYVFRGGCSFAYHQGTGEGPNVVLEDAFLKHGFAVATASNNRTQNNCNTVLSAESVMMVKEYFIERYGVPAYTVGFGGSGGAFGPRGIVHNYPGLLDGLIGLRPYPDIHTLNTRSFDCALLMPYFLAHGWTIEKQAAVHGNAIAPNGRYICERYYITRGIDKIDPTRGWNPVVPEHLRYHPVTNPTGARGTVWDNMVNIYGIDPATGFARRSYDNVGVQYGLNALNEGTISKTEFLDLNENVGGFDVDGQYVVERTQANLDGVRIEFATGRVSTGQGLQLPMIDLRNYRDDFNGDEHDRLPSFEMQARLLRDNGHIDNMVMWVSDRAFDIEGANVHLAVLGMDEWLEGLGRFIRHGSRSQPRHYGSMVVRTRPRGLVDGCWDTAGQKIDEPHVYGDETSLCNQLYPPHLNPRMVAGGPLTNDLFKCQLKPIEWSDYAVSFTPEERDRLNAIFPEGVCDWSRPDVARVPFQGPWQSFGP
jgi:hypothetical protein